MGYKYRQGKPSSPNHKLIGTKPMVAMNSTQVPKSSQAAPILATGKTKKMPNLPKKM
jgi:hypothetical protein